MLPGQAGAKYSPYNTQTPEGCFGASICLDVTQSRFRYCIYHYVLGPLWVDVCLYLCG